MKRTLIIGLIFLILIGIAYATPGDCTKFLNATLNQTVCVGGNAGIVNATGEGHFTTVNTGQGNYELFAMNQDVESTDAVTFLTINTGQGAQEVYGINTSALVVQTNNIGVVMSLWDGLFVNVGAANETLVACDNITGATSNLCTITDTTSLWALNSSVLINQSGELGVIKSWWDGLYCQLVGCTMAGDIAMGGSSITGALDINAT
ncbi:MAG: hypothetical protein ABH870_03360, partial [bacterium]